MILNSSIWKTLLSARCKRGESVGMKWHTHEDKLACLQRKIKVWRGQRASIWRKTVVQVDLQPQKFKWLLLNSTKVHEIITSYSIFTPKIVGFHPLIDSDLRKSRQVPISGASLLVEIWWPNSRRRWSNIPSSPLLSLTQNSQHGRGAPRALGSDSE